MTKTTYQVMAATGYAGHKEGETFEADLSPDEERRALDRGSIRKKTTKKTKEEKDG